MEENLNNTVAEGNSEETVNKIESHPTMSKRCCTGHWIGGLVALLALVGIYVLHFTGIGTHRAPRPVAESRPADPTAVGVKVAYIDTDTLMAKYEYALDLQKELEAYQASKEKSYEQFAQKFQSDYENFIKTGDQLTLAQQQQTEQDLKERSAKLGTLQNDYALQIQQKLMQDSEKMTKAVYAFIREYNEEYLHYDIILSKSFNSSPVLYGEAGLDITNEILEGLNTEYRSLKK